jgi:hypothetical protein
VNSDASSTNLEQLQEVGVKVAGGFGPVLWEPGQMSYVGKTTAEAIDKCSEAMVDLIVKDELNTLIAALAGAIEAGTSNTLYDAGTSVLNYRHLIRSHALFGDHSDLIVANVMDGTAYHDLIDANLVNGQQLYQQNGILVVDILGKSVVVTDAPALRETPSTTTNDAKILGLVSGAGTIYDASDVIVNIQTNNGKLRIETTFQSDYTFGVALKGYAWDTGNGGKSPTDAELATGSNWDKVATSYKHTAGVMATYETK